MLFRERGREGEREGEKHRSLPPIHASTGDQTQNTSMYTHWESNWQHFALWDDAQATELYQSGLKNFKEAAACVFPEFFRMSKCLPFIPR